MRIRDWSSDVCSSDLCPRVGQAGVVQSPDRVEQHHAVLIQQIMAMAEKFAILWRAHMFEHADRHNPVEMSPHVAIIDQFELDMIVDAISFRALAGDLELFLRRGRSEERRVGKECVSTGRSRWWPYT